MFALNLPSRLTLGANVLHSVSSLWTNVPISSKNKHPGRIGGKSTKQKQKRGVGKNATGFLLYIPWRVFFLADSFRPFTSPNCQSAVLMSDQNNLKPRAIRLRPGWRLGAAAHCKTNHNKSTPVATRQLVRGGEAVPRFRVTRRHTNYTTRRSCRTLSAPCTSPFGNFRRFTPKLCARKWQTKRLD